MPFLTLINVKVKNNNWNCLGFALRTYSTYQNNYQLAYFAS